MGACRHVAAAWWCDVEPAMKRKGTFGSHGIESWNRYDQERCCILYSQASPSLESAIHNQNKDENVDKFGERKMQFTSNEISIRTRIYLSIGSKVYIFFFISHPPQYCISPATVFKKL
jgi:hypothetical protein